MSKQTNYFKIGLFTLASLSLVIIFIILLGMGHLFQRSISAETYFDESIQGLNIGSPVKYRGVNVGKVTAIDMVNDIYGDKIDHAYNETRRYIYVRFSLTQQLNHSSATQDLSDEKEIIQNYVAKGLRASLATQDLVGNVFLSLNFVDNAESTPSLPISWAPKTIYIPSTPSTLSQLTGNITNIVANFNKVDFAKLINNINDLTVTMNENLKEAKINELSNKLNEALNETVDAMKEVNKFSHKATLFTVTQQNNWDSTFDTLHQMSLSLQSVSDTIKNNPSSIIFSQPTQSMDPSK